MAGETEKAMRALSSWGRQSISFAISLRAQKVGKPIDNEDRAKIAAAEVDATAQDLWTKALSECRQPVDAAAMAMKFAAHVFEWVTAHLRTTP